MKVVDIVNLSSSAKSLLKERVLAVRAEGIDNRILCRDGAQVPELEARGIPVWTVPMPRNCDPFQVVRAFAEIARYLRRNHVDVVHTHCTVPGVIGRLAASFAGVPVVIHTVHGFWFQDGDPCCKRWPGIAVEWFCGLFTDALLFQNAGDLAQANRLGIGPAAHRMRIGNGIDLERFRPGVHTRAAAEPVRIICVARFEPVKQHGMLLEAVARVLADGEQVRLWLVGEGELEGRLRADCAALGIADAVEFMGYSEDVPALLRQADIAVLTSLREGIPRAVLEAMAMGLPVVATRVPGTREVVKDGETGYLVESGDVAGCAAALRRLVVGPELRARMGTRGRALALREFDERPISRALCRTYLALARASAAHRHARAIEVKSDVE